jgi:hypothetical protein
MIDISLLDPLTNLKVVGSEEIVNVGQVEWLRSKTARGCTPECLACHFREHWLRDLHPDIIQSILEGEFEQTDLPSHGFKVVECIRRRMVDGVTETYLQDKLFADGVYYAVSSSEHLKKIADMFSRS